MMDIEIDSNERGAVDFALRIGKRRQAAHLARLASARLFPARLFSARLFSARTTRLRGIRTRRFLAALCTVFLIAPVMVTGAAAEPRHAIAMHGEPALPEGFTAFPYVNPDAPKGGRLVRGVLGTFDSLNPFIVKGLAPPEMRGAVYESLLVRGYDEPFTLYGLLARSVDTDDERSYVTFDLDPRATFADGKPVTAADVIFSWELLRDHGRPNYRIYYAKVARATALGERSVRFDIAADGDRELPLILGLMPILPATPSTPLISRKHRSRRRSRAVLTRWPRSTRDGA
jgi:ABC-type oligopeptide transport system substrate-binding subunit